MTSNTELLKIAQKHLGQGGATFRKYCGLPSGAAWCNAFVDYVANEGGVKSLYFNGAKETYCPHSIAWCKKNLAMIPLYIAMPMDIIYFDWDRNGVPNHIGFVRARKDTSSIYTIEGNTDGGKVAQKTRPSKYVQGIFRPHFRGKFNDKTLGIDGECGYQTIGGLQKALKILGYYNGEIDTILGKGTVKALQKFVGCSQDGAWGASTSRAVQKKICGFSGKAIDGQFGEQSIRAMQRWINANVYNSAQKKTDNINPKPVQKTTSEAKLKAYRIEVDLTNQICTVYGVYTDGKSKPIMSEFISSARKGCTTPTGNFKIQGASGGRKAKYRTCKLSGGKTYAEYACRFTGAKMMHGVPWKARNTKGYVYKNEFNKLGSVASAGCVRMPIKLARYIYNNCPVGTPVKVFKGTKGKYPMGKPKKYKATSNIDPTR